jgi:dihydroorotase
MFDLLITGGRVVDPGTGFDRHADVAFADGRVAAIAEALPPDNARERVKADGKYVVPGLIDLHTHVYWGGTSLGVDADMLGPCSGTTTFVDAGSAGAGNFYGFRKHVIERSKVRILAYLNVSFAGIFAFSRNVMVGECGDLRLCDAREALAAAREHLDIVSGMKVRVGRTAGGASGIGPLDIAIEVADQLQLPVMAHLDHPPPSRGELLPRLRKGDILTHCFKPFPNAPVDGARRIHEEILQARQRGIVFDIGHGMGSLSFESARVMLAHRFMPDVISSDVHALCVDGPAFDNLVTMSKFLCLGVPLLDVLRMVTSAPAAVLSRPDLGTLREGGIGDAAVLDLREGRFGYIDSVGEELVGTQRLFSDGIVVGGRWIASGAAR